MPKVKYDVSEVEDTDFKQAPKGVYRGKIVDTTVGESSSGQPMLTIVYELTHDSKGKKLKEKYGRIWHRVPLEHWDDTAGWTRRLKEFIKALGLKEKGSFDPEKLEGKTMQVVVRAGKDLDENYRAEVGKLMPLASDEDEDEDEETDDDEDEEDEDAEDDDDEEDEDEDEEEDEDEDEDEEDEDDEDDEEAEDYSDWSLNALKKEARSREIKVTKKMDEDDIRAALIESDGEEEDEEEDEDEEVDYSEWEADDLKKELKERGLKTNGSKKQMIARLEKDDSSGDDPF